ncbi:MAG: NUDIX domain-containing protein [Bacilli bacterium]|nr:NUDIX domain-containing protein [Bacilli bacterium]
MEYLDIYDENQNYLGKELRDVVHRDALWHKTVHCWLFDKDGNIYFQRRKDRKTLYTTASGHILAGETVKEGFGREIKEELGIDINYEEAILVDVVKFKMDKIKNDGTIFKDRAFANVNVYEYNDSDTKFNYDEEELSSIVKVNANDTLNLFLKGSGLVKGIEIIKTSNGINIETKDIDISEFLINDGETLINKYGDVLKKVIELTNK